MRYKCFDQIIEKCRVRESVKKIAVAGAAEEHVLKAIIAADQIGIASPILIGDEEKIKTNLTRLGQQGDGYPVVHAQTAQECGEKAVELVKAKTADFIMKGMVDTKDVLKPLVKKENGLHTGRAMNVFSYNEVPQMSHMLALADGGMIPYPTLEQKKDIILNCVEALHKLGIENPAIAVLAAVEKVNPKMPETTDAAALVEMNKNGQIPGCEIVGPISFDIAFSKEIAERKGYECPYCGDFDMGLVPSMVAGNLMHKAMILCGGAKMAGVIVGAKVPVVLTSRGASSAEKFASMALASLLS
ncbi:phosphate butyryltransferase [Clostridiales bacterium]|nr:phosphate butyryltransferase [Clostridiales bacterium]